MKLFGPFYERALVWARHRHAPALLTGLSFAEAVVFPVPPEVMLAPMALSQPRRGFWFASLSLGGSLFGAVLGYLLGHYAFELVKPLFEMLGWIDRIEAQVTQLREIAARSPWQAFWLLVLAGFTPIPLKIFTWASGIVGVPLLPFLASMAVGRGKRVYLIALAIRLGGERAEAALRRYIEPIGWAAMALLLAGLAWLIWKAQQGA
ncbi:YqaA family protein [Montanilutibacter psychrotolerans]|uniref:DedA family protein n=1 Tax=Montanilutibacter psychrotolerans TaxID=1327343 RepID=A0A3M8STM1_9GAMM|nr:YqaA family protein [Lysobacter psychrotolerans]RNF82574.1 DedA family protein [Lysobacter psychrotolerans]